MSDSTPNHEPGSSPVDPDARSQGASSSTGANQTHPSDESLMEQWLTNDAGAFDALYQRYRAALWQFVINRCDNEAHARELFQDVWMRVVHGRDGYTHGAPFRAWLFRIAINRLTDHYRQRPQQVLETGYEDSTTHAVTEIPI